MVGRDQNLFFNFSSTNLLYFPRKTDIYYAKKSRCEYIAKLGITFALAIERFAAD